METRAEGLATRVAHASAMKLLQDPERGLDDFVLVSDDALDEAIYLLLEHTHNLAERAGAAALAGALKLRERLAGRRVAIVLSGGNLTMSALAEIVARYGPA
jgi:threonine dehydratase